jgi:methionine synthase I (cobalamin-dependent)
MRIDEFQQRLRDSVLIADGAMGSLLYETVGPLRCVDELNATRAEEVFRIHMAYLEAGAHIIETNTFGANRNKLSAFGLEDRVTEFNHRGVKIAREAREAARHEVLIAGSIGPPGAFRDPSEAWIFSWWRRSGIPRRLPQRSKRFVRFRSFPSLRR